MADKLTQQLFPFGEVTVDAASARRSPASSNEPGDEDRAGFARLEGWLLDPRTGMPGTELAEQALRSVAHALLEGKHGWIHAAEDQLEALRVRNGTSEGEDIPAGIRPEHGDDFQRDVVAVLDRLRERMLTGKGPRC